jgi:hypothetical protein
VRGDGDRGTKIEDYEFLSDTQTGALVSPQTKITHVLTVQPDEPVALSKHVREHRSNQDKESATAFDFETTTGAVSHGSNEKEISHGRVLWQSR